MKMARLFVEDAMHLSFHPKANSMPDVAGQALMKRFQMR
jgi:hypothetical protein